jgi:hypothetical protein
MATFEELQPARGTGRGQGTGVGVGQRSVEAPPGGVRHAWSGGVSA